MPCSRRSTRATLSLFAAALALGAVGCSGDSNDTVTASKEPPKSAPAAEAKPLDGVAKKIEAAGYKVARDTTGAANAADALAVQDGKLNFSVTVYQDSAAADESLSGLADVRKSNPRQIAVLQDASQPAILATGTVEAPAKLPVKRFLKLADLSIDADPVDVAKLETGTAVKPAVKPKPKPKPKPEPEPEPEPERETGGSITVPNVVGKDHQLAQDSMQAAGLYLLQEEDCTGQDRALIYDRNWTVVRQSPAGGSKADEDTTITLCSKKDGE